MRSLPLRLLCSLLFVIPLVIGRVTALPARAAAPRCVFDTMSLYTLPGECRPVARSYPRKVKGPVKRAIYNSALVYGIPYPVLLRVARCESRLNPRAVNGAHYGLYQFLPSTFSEGVSGMEHDTGITATSYWNPNDAAYVAGYLFATGDSVFWACH